MTKNTTGILKYRTLLIIFTLYCIFWIVIAATLREESNTVDPLGLSRIVPVDDAPVELALIFTFYLPISSVFGVIFGGYCISPIVLFFHKKIYGFKMHYGIQYEKSSDRTKLISRAPFPVLMAINIASMFLTPVIIEFILNADLANEIDSVARAPSLTRLLAEINLLPITLCLTSLFFSSVWFLKDSGIIYSSKEKLQKSNESFTLKSIGEWFQTMLRSYAGIGALITYILIIYNFITDIIQGTANTKNVINILSLILWLGLPFYLAISLIPSLIVNDIIKRHRVRYIRNIGKKIGISESVEITFEFKKDRL
ncbi:MAG: hypothetical protein ACXAEX_09190 [Promethearchaeota archaeon]|jgi:hypothetical protein